MHPESTPTWLVGPEIPPTQRIGTVLSGSYRLDAFLGQGLTGITYNAWHLRQKQPYAVKLLHRELQPSHERVLRLRTDLRVLSGLRRQGFLPVELSFAPDGAPFLASELLIGETLRERLSRGPLPSLAAGIVVAAVARALGEAHKLGVVHGDLRPENVLLPSEPGREVEAGQPVLLDAALHHLRRRPLGLDDSLPLHKLAYLAPEQTSGEQSTADAAGDMFALGAILYECLTGKAAFAADELEVVYEKLSQPPAKLVLPREVGAPPGLSEALDEVIARACARSPADRYATMAEFLDALGAAYKQVGLPLPPPDERVAIDTVLSQNRGLRKRTVAVKKIGPATSPGAPAEAAARSSAGVEPAVEPAVAKPAENTKSVPTALAKSEEAGKSTEAPRAATAPRQPTPAPRQPTPVPRQPTPVPTAVEPAAAAPRQSLPTATPTATPVPAVPSTSVRRPTPAPGSASPRQSTETATSVPAVPSTSVRRPTPAPGSAAESSKAVAAPPAANRSTPLPVEPPKAAAPAAPAAEPRKSPEVSTAKHRAIRRTVKARDLGRLLAEVAAGRLDPSQAMAIAAGQEDEPVADSEANSSAGKNEAERVIAEGRAAVLARAEAARKNRQVEADERVQRAQEQQRRLLEQARQETLARMRAELADSRSAQKPVAKDGEDKGPVDDSELLAEAEQQRERLEAERVEAERQAAQEAQRAHEESTAADLARTEAARAEAALREAEQREAARAEAMRVHTEREAEARRIAEQAEAERVRQSEEALAAEHAAAAARTRAAEAAAAAERARNEVEREAEMAAWEEGLEELVEPSRPPPPPLEAVRAKSERALHAIAEAKKAEEQAAEAAERAEAVRKQAADVARAAEAAMSAVTAAEQARAREAEDLAEAVASAEAARSRDHELLQLAAAAAERAHAAESARQRHAARATRVTQALAVLKQVEDMAQKDPKVTSKTEATPSPSASQSLAAPGGKAPLPSAVTAPGGNEPSGIYAGYTLSEVARRDLAREASANESLKAAPAQRQGSRPEFTGPYAPAQLTPAVEQATQSPTRPMPVVAQNPPHQDPPSEVVEISAMLPGAAIPIPMSQPGMSLPHGMGMPMAAGASGSGAMPVLQRSMSVSAMHPMMGVPGDTRQMMMPQLMPPMSAEPSGVTLTVRQFVVTLTVTSLLSAIIGALIALLVMQRSQPAMPIDRPIIASRTPALESPSEVTAAPPLTAPSPPATPPSSWRPASVRLPPLRLSTDLPFVRPRFVGQPPAGAQPQRPAANPASPPAPSAATGDTPPAPASEAKPAEQKPAAPAKSGGTPPANPDDGLRNPFGP